MSDQFNEAVTQNMEKSYEREDQFFLEYYNYLKQYPTVISRFHRLCRNLSRDLRIILKAEILPTLSFYDQQKYYDMLSDFDMRILDEALDCIREIATSKDSQKELRKWAKLPWFDIQNYDDEYYTVTFLGHQYSFQSLRFLYGSDVEKICDFHRMEHYSVHDEVGYDAYAPGNLDYACHFSSYHFALMHPNLYAMTSLCPHTVNDGVWYHSYNLSGNEKTVYDVANGFIMDYDCFQKLLEPINLDQTLGASILEREKELLQADNFFYQMYGDYCPLKGFAFQNFDRMEQAEQAKLLKNISRF